MKDHWVRRRRRYSVHWRQKRGVAAQCGVQNDMQHKVECMNVQVRKRITRDEILCSVCVVITATRRDPSFVVVGQVSQAN